MKIVSSFLLILYLLLQGYVLAQTPVVIPAPLNPSVEAVTSLAPPTPEATVPAKETLENLIEITLKEISQNPEQICSLSSKLLSRLEHEPNLIKEHLRTGLVARGLFTIRKLLIDDLPKTESYCSNNTADLYIKLKLLEHDLALNSKIIAQGNLNSIENEFESIFNSKTLSSMQLKNSQALVLQNGDLLLLRELPLSLSILSNSNYYPLPYDSVLVVQKSLKAPYIMTIEPIEGPIKNTLEDFLNGYGGGFFEFIVLRAKDHNLQKTLGAAFDAALKKNEPPSNSLFDFQFNIKNNEKAFSTGTIYKAINSFAPNSLSKFLKTPKTDSNINPQFPNNNQSFILERDFIFSGLFTIEAEWTLGKAYRIEDVKKVAAPLIKNALLTKINESIFIKYFIQYSWSFRDYEIIASQLKKFGISSNFIHLESFSDALYLSKLEKVLTTCASPGIDLAVKKKSLTSTETFNFLKSYLNSCIEKTL